MVQQFLLDKPITYFILIFLILILLTFKKQKMYSDLYLIILTNTLLVIFLMILFWQKSDVQSSYRYLMNIFYLLLYPCCNMLDDIFRPQK